MHQLIEIWSAKPAWLELAREDRQSFTDRILAALGPIMESGMSVTGAGQAMPAVSGSTSHSYFAVWECEDAVVVRQFLEALEKTGWGEYFEQANVLGISVPLAALLEQQIAL